MPGTVTSPGLILLDEMGYTLCQVSVYVCVYVCVLVGKEAVRESGKGWSGWGGNVCVNETEGQPET